MPLALNVLLENILNKLKQTAWTALQELLLNGLEVEPVSALHALLDVIHLQLDRLIVLHAHLAPTVKVLGKLYVNCVTHRRHPKVLSHIPGISVYAQRASSGSHGIQSLVLVVMILMVFFVH